LPARAFTRSLVLDETVRGISPFMFAMEQTVE